MGRLIYTPGDPEWAVPKDVKIRLRGRSLWSHLEFSIIIEFDLSRHSTIELQLDASLILGFGTNVERSTWCMGMMEDIAGVIIDVKLCVDDEPFWTYKIKEDEIYNIAYIQRPFWWNPLIWIIDRYRKTPLVQEEDIPELNPYWETSAACMRLKRRGRLSEVEIMRRPALSG
ncbi:hypothetical protein DFP73DRAFT_585539 [Morchella snyderi]|nr:hypothetical protein DFP73DRAFT_585539 [Morchella snyderi]